MLGPGVNLARVPWGGRNFEYQGEDPVLAGRMVYQEVRPSLIDQVVCYLLNSRQTLQVLGIQSQNISACVKHYVNNNQEYNRNTVSEQVRAPFPKHHIVVQFQCSPQVPQRAEWELYYQPFMAAVDAGVGSAMCSYNRINVSLEY
jgi:beta-glucosidase